MKNKSYRHKEVVPSQKQYIRVGDLPPDGKSKIRRRADNSIIGEEEGISVFEYIEGYYNTKRPHGTLNMLTPNEAEALYWEQTK